jgi:DNA polymerase IV (DinB-like DNA polymerase)
MDYFFAQIEERENPQFKGMPIIVGADPKRGRGVVSTCNYSARRHGIHSGLSISKAYQLCPKAIFLPVNKELYRKVSERIMKIIKKYSSTFEQASLDEAYLDISFLLENKSDKEKAWKKAENLAKKLKKEIWEKEKLTSTIGIGPNKLIAKMVAEKAKPNGLLIIKPNQVKKFLEPLNIEDLPGIGLKTKMKIAKRFFQIPKATTEVCYQIKIKQLKRISKRKLVNLLGKVGETIWERARGMDQREVLEEKIIKSIGREITFEKDTRDPKIIFETFEKIIKEVYQELLKNKFFSKNITVVCRFQSFETHNKSKTLKKPTNNLEILKKESKKLLLKFLLENPKPIRLIGLRLKIY